MQVYKNKTKKAPAKQLLNVNIAFRYIINWAWSMDGWIFDVYFFVFYINVENKTDWKEFQNICNVKLQKIHSEIE